MPSRAPTLCRCGRPVAHGERCPCRPTPTRAPDTRGSAASRGYDADWRRLRERHLADRPLCVACLEDEVVEVAVEVDHVVPVRRAPERRLDPSNLQSLCRRCHAAKTARERSRTPARI